MAISQKKLALTTRPSCPLVSLPKFASDSERSEDRFSVYPMWPPIFLLVSTEEFHDVAPHFRQRPVGSGILQLNGSLLIEWIDALPAKW